MDNQAQISFFHRRLTDRELADLPPAGWDNAAAQAGSGDAGSRALRKAWEVDRLTYEEARAAGVMARVVDFGDGCGERYILANG